MNKTKIEWCDYTWNPIVGCKRGCPYCYANKIQKRFHPELPFSILQRHYDRLEQPLKIKKPSKIFVGSMSDIEWWTQLDMQQIFKIVSQCPQHIFLFLTKNGMVYEKYDFPKNCWLGVSTTDGNYMFHHFPIKKGERANLLFLSLTLLKEPERLWLNPFIDWVIVGGLTPNPKHKNIWVTNIIKECRRLSIPVFVKNNVKYPIKIQEFP